jgi:hypothetical protein
MKYCKKCEKNKELAEFGKDKQKSDGLSTYCKECIKKRSEEQRKKNPKYYEKYAENYRQENREILRKKGNENYKKNPEKYLELGRISYHRHKEEIAKRRKIKRSSPEAREKENLRQNEWRKQNKEKYGAYVRKWQKANRIKINAHAKVHRAVENGTLIRGIKCEECGTGKGKMEGHHEDYNKPLQLIWLCRLCHANKTSKL